MSQGICISRPCHYCGKPVDPTSGLAWRRAVGWEHKAARSLRKGDVILREYRDEWACDVCIAQLKRKLTPGQESLV